MRNCNKKRYAIDIDQTICETINGDYNNSKPIYPRIWKINKLFDEGNSIIYFSARGMSSNKGDVDACYDQYFELTTNQLKKWGCKYDNLVLGKLSYDYIVDDKAINSDEFFNNLHDFKTVEE